MPARKPTDKERAQLQHRLERLQDPHLKDHLDKLDARLRGYARPGGQLPTKGLRLREQFAYLSEPIAGDFSDRKAPPRKDRPPATQISSSQGSALRLELMVLALLQMVRKPGTAARLADLKISIAGDSQHTGWADLVAASPADSHPGENFYKARDKRARTVRSALKTLEKAGLVDVPAKQGARNRFEGFVLLQEVGAAASEREAYTIPALGTPGVFTMPRGFILNGWLHVLSDTEIAVLLMAACGAGAWSDHTRGGRLAFSGEVRLTRYGIHRDPYAAARKTLEWFGLLDVEEVDRHLDGRAENDNPQLNRIWMRREGFEKPARATITDAIQEQLSR